MLQNQGMSIPIMSVYVDSYTYSNFDKMEAAVTIQYQEHNDHLDISVMISYLKELCTSNCRYFLRAKVPRHAVIKKFGGEEISQLEDLISVLSKLARGARVPLEYISYLDRHRRKVLVIIYFPLESIKDCVGRVFCMKWISLS